jgi:hypothetical protein
MTWDSATQASTRTTSVAMKIDLSVLGGTPSISDHDTGGSFGTGSRSVGAGGSGGGGDIPSALDNSGALGSEGSGRRPGPPQQDCPDVGGAG